MSISIEGGPLLRFLRDDSAVRGPAPGLFELLESREKVVPPKEAKQPGGSEKPFLLDDLGPAFIDEHACVML